MTQAVIAYVGSHEHTLDAKGRVSVPAEFRRGVGEQFMLTRGHEGCLYLYPMETWNRLHEQMTGFEYGVRDSRRYLRMLLDDAKQVTVDDHGRVMVPRNLRELAKLEGDVLFCGVLNHIEIWNPDVRRRYDEKAETVTLALPAYRIAW